MQPVTVTKRPASEVSMDYTKALQAPATFSAAAGDGQMTLSWSAPSDSSGTAALTQYQYRYGSGDPVSWVSWTDVADSDADSDVTDETSITIGSLTNGTEYSFQLRAVNSAGDGAAASAMATNGHDECRGGLPEPCGWRGSDRGARWSSPSPWAVRWWRARSLTRPCPSAVRG